MSDMSSTIIPKSDQLNSDDLIAGTKTITITGVTIRSGQQQPISIHFDGDNGKPYKPCKGMCRVMVNAWGPSSKNYIGRSLTLFREPTVLWGGMQVGGIQISHMSDISSPITLALTVNKSNRKPFTVRPLEAAGKTKQPAAAQNIAPADASLGAEAAASAADPTTTDAQPDALLVLARDWAEHGTEQYADWFANKITKKQRKHIGADRHETLKQIAAKVTV